MSGFDAMVSAHVRGLVTSPLHRGEPVAYAFKSGAADRPLNAMVIRPAMAPAMSGARRVGKHRAIVVIANHATEGVTQVVDGDAIKLAIERGGPIVECRIREVVLNEGGSWHLEVQAP